MNDVELDQVAQEGFPVAHIPPPPEALSPMSAGYGLMGLLTNPPHPNAQKLLANWLANKEGLTAWSIATGVAPPLPRMMYARCIMLP